MWCGWFGRVCVGGCYRSDEQPGLGFGFTRAHTGLNLGEDIQSTTTGRPTAYGSLTDSVMERALSPSFDSATLLSASTAKVTEYEPAVSKVHENWLFPSRTERPAGTPAWPP